jgi:CDP-diacylglycerol--glycerol-3-phosphate 3-phosphatidyltransferase
MSVSTPQEPGTRGGSTVIQFPNPAQRRKAAVSISEETAEENEREEEATASDAGAASGQGDAAAPNDAGSERRLDGSGLPVEEFWNLPNTVTMLRTGVIPILLFLPLTQGITGSRFMAWAFIVAALTDWLDGYLARRHGGRDVTRIGKLLDPLADKLIVSTALIMLLAIGRIPVWASAMVVVIVGRELAVTGLRGIASSQGQIVAARGPGKIKTIAQSAATAALLFHFEIFGLPAHEIGMTLLAIATVLTLWSGYLYFADYFGWNRSS